VAPRAVARGRPRRRARKRFGSGHHRLARDHTRRGVRTRPRPPVPGPDTTTSSWAAPARGVRPPPDTGAAS
jgi:hypothetical protein